MVFLRKQGIAAEIFRLRYAVNRRLPRPLAFNEQGIFRHYPDFEEG